jgi:phosphatidylglycerophosphate synthase
VKNFQRQRRVLYKTLSEPLGRACLKLGLTPTFLTVGSLFCALFAGICFWQQWLLLGVVMILANIFADMLDGATARAGNLSSAFGGILDHVSDRYGEAFILVGISLSGIVNPLWGIFALFGMIIASYTREAAEATGKIKNIAVGIVGRLDKLSIIMIGVMLEHFLPGHNLLTYTLIIVGSVSYITSVQRLLYAKKTLNRQKSER